MSMSTLVRNRAVRSFGWWMVLAAMLYLLINAVTAATAPVSFAKGLGLPLTNTADDGFAIIYATRTTVIAILALILALRADIATLSLLVLVSIFLPLTDAAVVASQHAAVPTVLRHLSAAA